MSRLSCVQNFLCPDYRAFKIAYVQTIVRSKLHMSRLSCVHFFSRPCNFERTLCVHFGLDISTFGLGPQPGKLLYQSTTFCVVSVITVPRKATIEKISFHDTVTSCSDSKLFNCVMHLFSLSVIRG